MTFYSVQSPSFFFTTRTASSSTFSLYHLSTCQLSPSSILSTDFFDPLLLCLISSSVFFYCLLHVFFIYRLLLLTHSAIYICLYFIFCLPCLHCLLEYPLSVFLFYLFIFLCLFSPRVFYSLYDIDSNCFLINLSDYDAREDIIYSRNISNRKHLNLIVPHSPARKVQSV